MLWHIKPATLAFYYETTNCNMFSIKYNKNVIKYIKND